jgi:hypothetical protein
LTSSDFTFAFGATAAATAVGSNTWTDTSNTNSPPTQGDFTLLPAPTGQIQSNNGPKFFERNLYDGDPESDRVGALSDPFSAGGFSLPITASYNGPAPVDAAPTPNYRLRIELTRVSIYAAATQNANKTLAWDEITPGFAQTSSTIDLTLANTAELLQAASSYTPLIWDPADFNASIGSPNNSFTRTFDFLPNTSGLNNGKVGDGIQVEGRVHLIYDTVSAGDPTWNVDSSGDYNNSSNWANGVPNGIGATAFFGAAISSARTVYTDTAVTLGTIKFENNNSYQLTGQGSLKIDVTSGDGSISVLQGNHKLNLPVEFAKSTAISVAASSSLTLANPATIKANQTVTKSGNVVISAPLTLESGAALVNAGGLLSVFGAPALSSGARIDVKTNSMTIDYRGQSSPASTIRSQLASGYANGAWTGEGISTTSSTSTTGVGWVETPATQSIAVKYAYYGDANLSGTVDSTDFSAFIAGYGQTTGGIWANGDFNYDGKVNTQDFNSLAGNFGAPALGASLGAVVPEPAAASLLLIAGIGMLARRRSAC